VQYRYSSEEDNMSYKIEAVVKDLLLGEGPHWCGDKQELIYVDIPGKHVHRYVPATGTDYSVAVDGRVTFVIPIQNEKNKYVIGLERDVAVLEWDGISKNYTSLKIITSVESNYPKNRFNDGKCDPQGRIWTGTMGYETTPGNVDPEKGNLYRLDLEGKLSLEVDKINISNGLAWSKDSTKFFYVDSCAYSIDVFDFDAASGKASNRRVLFDLKKNGISGLPDGMVADIDDNLWLAVYTGGKILHIDSKTGKIIKTIDFTGRASKITSAAFGGKNLDELYVTSAKMGLTPEQLAVDKDAGALFKVTNLGTKGQSAGVSYKGKLKL
jgi:gluconolactonase